MKDFHSNDSNSILGDGIPSIGKYSKITVLSVFCMFTPGELRGIRREHKFW